MTRNVVITILLLCHAFLLSAQQSSDTKQAAQNLNQRAEAVMKQLAGRDLRDSVARCKAIVSAVNYSLQCDEYDRMPQRNGQVKTRFVNQNRRRLLALHEQLLYAGDYLLAHHQEEAAREAYVVYMNAAENRLLSDQPDNSGLAAHALAQIALDKRNYKQADRYANMALAYDNSAQFAAEIKAQCMRAQMITPQDSAKYLAVINKLYETDPNNDKYFAWIMQFYDRPQQRHKLEYFVDQELENNPNSIVPWILKGEIAMKAERWDEAIEAYQHADEIDPGNVAVAFNAGVSLTNKAVELDKQRREHAQMLLQGNNAASATMQADEQQIKQLFTEARTYLERVKGRDPKRKRVDWVKPLYLVYSVLGDKVKATDLEPIVNGFSRK